MKFAIPLCLAVCCLAQPAPPGKLKINVLAGQGAVNNILQGVAAQPAVEVVNEANAPVAGAEVTFETPAEGAGATFFGTRTYTGQTDARGRVQVNGMAPNNFPGKFNITVKAKTANAAGETTIAQSNGGPNSLPAGTSNYQASKKKFWIITAAVLGAAVGGGIAASNASGGGNGTTTSTTKRPVTIGAGPITVGGPR